MKIQYASDLHREFEENTDYLKRNPLEVTGDILVLAGDTAYLGKTMSKADWFFDWCAANYKQTYLIPGNHEYYDGFPLMETLPEWQMDICSNVHYLNNRSVKIGDAELFFTTLWTKLEPVEIHDVQLVMNDFKMISLDGTNRYLANFQNRIHKICGDWLSQSLKSSVARKKIVVSHHCPIADPEVRRYVGAMAYPAYAEDMTMLIKETMPDYWIHGHSHSRCTNGKVIGETKILSNALGYVDELENAGFNTKAIIEI